MLPLSFARPSALPSARMATAGTKNATRERRQRIEGVRQAWQRGDYRRARLLAAALYAAGPVEPVEEVAQAELQRAARLPHDAATLALGAATTFFYLAAWAWAKFGDHAAGIARFG